MKTITLATLVDSLALATTAMADNTVYNSTALRKSTYTGDAELNPARLAVRRTMVRRRRLCHRLTSRNNNQPQWFLRRDDHWHVDYVGEEEDDAPSLLVQYGLCRYVVTVDH